MSALPVTDNAGQRRVAELVNQQRSIEDRLRSNDSITRLAFEARNGKSRRATA